MKTGKAIKPSIIPIKSENDGKRLMHGKTPRSPIYALVDGRSRIGSGFPRRLHTSAHASRRLLTLRVWLTLGDSGCLLLIHKEIVLHEEIRFCRRIGEDGSEAGSVRTEITEKCTRCMECLPLAC